MTQKTYRSFVFATLILSVVCFGLGMYFPILSTHKQLVFRFSYKEINIFDSVKIFFEEKEYFIATMILFFTFIFPVLNYIELIYRGIKNKTIKTLRSLEKWSMLDVFLVAILLINFKMNSKILVMNLQIGTVFIALAVIFRVLTITLMSNKRYQEI